MGCQVRVNKGAPVTGEGPKVKAARYVPAGRDRYRGRREVLFTRTGIDIKVSTPDTDGGLCVTEITSPHKGGRRGTCTTGRTSGSTSSRAST
jgi:hypothetical protein